MGHMKELLAKTEELRSIAKTLLQRTGVIDVCDFDGYYVSLRDLTSDDYAIITSIAKKEFGLEKSDSKAFHAAIKAVFDESGVESIKEHVEAFH